MQQTDRQIGLCAVLVHWVHCPHYWEHLQTASHDFDRADWPGFRAFIAALDTSINDSVQTMNQSITDRINEAKDLFIPKRILRSRKYQKPWMRNAGLKRQRAAKIQAWNTYSRSRDVTDYDDYKYDAHNSSTFTGS